VRVDLLARQYYGSPPMLTTLRLPQTAQRPGTRYLEWHRGHVFTDRRPTARTLPGETCTTMENSRSDHSARVTPRAERSIPVGAVSAQSPAAFRNGSETP
jgi:hypothetical protein